MVNYDRQEALAFILPRVKKALPKGCELDTTWFVTRAIALDIAYMQQENIVDSEGYMGDGEYDEDDAFEFILDALLEERPADDALEAQVMLALDAFMPAQEEYMTKAGLADGTTED